MTHSMCDIAHPVRREGDDWFSFRPRQRPRGHGVPVCVGLGVCDMIWACILLNVTRTLFRFIAGYGVC